MKEAIPFLVYITCGIVYFCYRLWLEYKNYDPFNTDYRKLGVLMTLVGVVLVVICWPIFWYVMAKYDKGQG